MSARAERLARARGIVDRRHGEKIFVTPMARPGEYGGASVDPAREPFDVVGQLLVAAGSQTGFSDNAHLQIPAGRAELYVDPDAWPKARDMKTGDRLRGEDHPGSLFEVDRLDRRQLGRLVYRLIVKED